MDALSRIIPVYILVSVRFLGVFHASPVFLASSMPVPFRFWLSAVLALIFVPQMDGQIPEILFSGVLPLVLASAREFLTGLFLGFLAAAPFYALQVSGRMIGTSMGLAMVSVMDPLTQDEGSIIGQFKLLVGLWFFLYWNGHLLLVKAFFESYRLLPLGGFGLSLPSHMGLGRWLQDLFVLAFMMSVPFYGALLLADIGLGFLARTVPQMNVFILGLPVKIGLGLALLMALLPVMVEMIHRNIEVFLRLAMRGLSLWR